jgi:outer membrane protein assembly factor BamC
MRNNKVTTIGLLILSQTCVTSCSYIKTMFPDKEKDYQFTTEIAPLSLPDDILKRDAASPAMPAPSAVAETSTASSTEPAATPEPSPEPSSSGTEPAPEAEPANPLNVELVKDSNEPHLRFPTPIIQTWRTVDKALSRNSIEVTKRDQDGGLFTIQYDPKERSQEDGSLWDEMKFIFSGFENAEEEMTLLLSNNGSGTDVHVLDSGQKPINDMNSQSLLNLLYNTIKADPANKAVKQ